MKSHLGCLQPEVDNIGTSAGARVLRDGPGWLNLDNVECVHTTGYVMTPVLNLQKGRRVMVEDNDALAGNG